jgi:hypothetical protein
VYSTVFFTMAFSLLKQVTVLAVILCVSATASTPQDDAKPVVGPSFAQGSMKFQSAGLLSKEEGDSFAQLADEFDAHQTIADDQPTTQGRNLAQVAAKFVGAKLPSEEGDVFAQLDDEFDSHQTIADDQPTTQGRNLAQIAAKFVGAKLPSEIMDQQMTDFASLDDAFDASVWQMEQEQQAFSLLALLTNPSLYFTIAFVLIAGLVLSSPPPATPEVIAPAQHQQPSPAVVARLRFPGADHTEASAQNVEVVEVSKVETAAAPETSTASIEGPLATKMSQESLMEAASACRAGEPGSYENFCKILSGTAHSN